MVASKGCASSGSDPRPTITTEITRCSPVVSVSGTVIETARLATLIASISRSTAAPSAGLPAGDFASMRATRSSSAGGTRARIAEARGGSSSSTFASTAITFSPAKAWRPVRHSNATHPSAKTSARASTLGSPRACSGAMYPGVPMAAPVRVRADDRATRATPKSSTFTRSIEPPSRKMLLGLTSRWSTPRAWAAASALATLRVSVIASAMSRRPSSRRVPRSKPSSHSRTR